MCKMLTIFRMQGATSGARFGANAGVRWGASTGDRWLQYPRSVTYAAAYGEEDRKGVGAGCFYLVVAGRALRGDT